MPTITTTPIPTRNTGTADAASSLRLLLCWLSPAFPVGAYAYSHGLEWAVEAGDVRDEGSLEDWLACLLTDGVGRSDGILLAAAHRAIADGDGEAFAAANDLALAFAPSAELRLETAQQGCSFLDTVLASWPAPGLDAHAGEIAYPVALGLAAACHGIALRAAVEGYLTALAGNLVTAAIRLAPIGQTAGQRVLARLTARVGALAEVVLSCDLEEVGGATFRADLGSLRHETQYTRLFRS